VRVGGPVLVSVADLPQVRAPNSRRAVQKMRLLYAAKSPPTGRIVPGGQMGQGSRYNATWGILRRL